MSEKFSINPKMQFKLHNFLQMKHYFRSIAIQAFTYFLIYPAFAQNAMPFQSSKEEVLTIIEKVNDHWQTTHPDPGNAFWDNAAYHTGNIAAFKALKKKSYKEYSEKWAEQNHWKGATSGNKTAWKYKPYGESPEHVLFGDWQICFQTYIDLYNLDKKKNPEKIARAKEVMEYQVGTSNSDYWWWVDGLYMVMPVMTKMYKLTGNPIFLEKLHQYFSYTDSIMFDSQEHLYYRDAKYIYPKHTTDNGKKDFWARGVGWIFAGLAKVLTDLPQDDPHRAEYIEKFTGIAQALVKSQQSEGYWSRSLLDPAQAPGYETSGTAFFTYGLFWGINNGYLEKDNYLPAAIKGWNYLKNIALQDDGSVGYVQPIGERASQHQQVGPNTTANFGVGAFLLAATEVAYYLSKEENLPPVPHAFCPGQQWLDNRQMHINAHGGGILYHNGMYYWFGEHRPERGFATTVGITCYSSSDLYNWKYENVALSIAPDEDGSEIIKGCIMERPKVIYNAKNKQFVMYFHLELKGKGYEAARTGIAVSDHITGPFRFIRSCRPNPNAWPLNFKEEYKHRSTTLEDFKEWWTPEWTVAVKEGLFTRRDLSSGQMSRDMTLFVDDDGKAYHIYSSEENLTLQIAELTDDYLDYTGRYIRVEPGGHNEAPVIFKKDGKYFMITSGCTGWAPNAARLLTANHILGEWTLHPNPCLGENANSTFHSQGTYALKVEGKKDAYIFMADRWKPKSLMESSYVWLPIRFKDGLPVLEWKDQWNLEELD